MEENELNYDAQHYVDLFQGDTVSESESKMYELGTLFESAQTLPTRNVIQPSLPHGNRSKCCQSIKSIPYPTPCKFVNSTRFYPTHPPPMALIYTTSLIPFLKIGLKSGWRSRGASKFFDSNVNAAEGDQ